MVEVGTLIPENVSYALRHILLNINVNFGISPMLLSRFGDFYSRFLFINLGSKFNSGFNLSSPLYPVLQPYMICQYDLQVENNMVNYSFKILVMKTRTHFPNQSPKLKNEKLIFKC